MDEAIIRVELGLACASEKLINLSGFMMYVATKEGDFEAFISKEEQSTIDYIEKAMEFTLLSRILDSEVDELDNLMTLLQTEITVSEELLSSYTYLGETFKIMKERLCSSKESLKQLQEQVSEVKMESLKFQRTFSCSNEEENWNNDKQVFAGVEDDVFSSKNVLVEIQIVEQQRHILRMLDKSLAREMELEKKLTESKEIEENLNMRIHTSEQVAFTLSEKVNSLKCEISEMRNVITYLKEKESKAEAKYKLLTETNIKLNEDLGLLKTQLSELSCGCIMPWQLLKLARRYKTC